MLQQCPVTKSRSNLCNMPWEQFCFKICAQRIEKKTRTQRSALNHLYGKSSNPGPGENSNETVHSVKLFRKTRCTNTFRGNYLFLASTSSRNFLQYHFSTKLKTSAKLFPRGKQWRIRVNESKLSDVTAMFNSHRPLLASQQNGSNDTAQWKSAIPSVQKVHSNDKRSKRIVPVTENFRTYKKIPNLSRKLAWLTEPRFWTL